MESEVLLTGIGGQGVQLAAQILARAATIEGRHVMFLGTYGGTMRGGNTDATVILGDEPIVAPPIVAQANSAIAMHAAHWPALRRKLRPGAVAVVNCSFFGDVPDDGAIRRFDVPATEWASEMGAPQSAALILLSAFCGMTGSVGIDALIEAMRDSLPRYRSALVDANASALRRGFESQTTGAVSLGADASDRSIGARSSSEVAP